MIESTKVIDKVCDKVSPVAYCVVLKEGNLVSRGAMGRWHTPPPPVPAVPPSQTNDCKGFLRFTPSQRRPKMAVGRPKRRTVSCVCVHSDCRMQIADCGLAKRGGK